MKLASGGESWRNIKLLIKSTYMKLLKPELAWVMFCSYYPERAKAKSKRIYYRERKKAFKKWLARLQNQLRMNEKAS